MNYYRLYPDKNNTIISSNKTLDPYKEINSGKLTIMELHKGKTYSELLFQFQIPEWIKQQWEQMEAVNLKLWDAGAIYSNVLGETRILITSFYEDFVEGNGWSLNPNSAQAGVSNFTKKNDIDAWVEKDLNTNLSKEYQLDGYHDDIYLDVKELIDITKDTVCFKVNVFTNDYTENERIKFIHSKHTRTIYKPYLEFKNGNIIKDDRSEVKRGEINKIYFINQTLVNLAQTVTCNVNTNAVTVQNDSPGVYFIEYTPTDNEDTIKVEWFVNNKKAAQYFSQVKENYLLQEKPVNFVTYYINAGNTANVYRVGDVLRFNVESFIQGLRKFEPITYEYMVVTNNGFEMQPWTECNIYNENIFFFINTEYYFPELDYEIILRINDSGIIKTAKDGYKFKLHSQSGTRLKELNANPYYTRNLFFSK